MDMNPPMSKPASQHIMVKSLQHEHYSPAQIVLEMCTLLVTCRPIIEPMLVSVVRPSEADHLI